MGNAVFRSQRNRFSGIGWPMTKTLLAWMSGAVLCAHGATGDAFWPQWRGPLCTGEAPLADPPLHWSETNNVKWKTPIPGEGDATPIVWDQRIFLLTALPATGSGGALTSSETPQSAYRFTVLCLNRADGKILWQKVAREEIPHEGHQENNTYASASPVTDGMALIAYFGSRGLYCYDLDGNLKWQKDFGKMKTRMGFGEGASAALSGGTVIVNWDSETGGFIAALDKATGRELWRTERDEATGWSTPLVVETGGQKQVVVNATKAVRAYDLATGKEIWSCRGQTPNAIPSPVAAGGVVYLTSGFRGAALQAIRLGGTGDLTESASVIWSHAKNTPYVPSPLLTAGLIYAVKGNDAILSCFDAATGQPRFEAERLEAIHSIYASPVCAKDRLYVMGRDGACVVLRKGPNLETLAVNTLAEGHTDASMALAGNEAFVRTGQSLYCLAEPAPR